MSEADADNGYMLIIGLFQESLERANPVKVIIDAILGAGDQPAITVMNGLGQLTITTG